MIAQDSLILPARRVVGIALGGGLGYGVALVARHPITRFRGLRRCLALLPWRTIIVTVPLLFVFAPLLIGLVPRMGAIMGDYLWYSMRCPSQQQPLRKEEMARQHFSGERTVPVWYHYHLI